MTEDKVTELKAKGFYTWLGEEGILIDHEIEGVKAYAESDDGKFFYPFSMLPDGDYEPLTTFDDELADLIGTGEEITCAQVVNPENDQCLLPWFFVGEQYYNDDLYERELLTETNQYYEWTSERTSFIDHYTTDYYVEMSEEEFAKEKETAKKEWEEIVAKYTTSCLDSPDFDKIWEEIDYAVSNMR